NHMTHFCDFLTFIGSRLVPGYGAIVFILGLKRSGIFFKDELREISQQDPSPNHMTHLSDFPTFTGSRLVSGYGAIVFILGLKRSGIFIKAELREIGQHDPSPKNMTHFL
ncbi:unnamed protein product, partial [Owenia fusiformis]